MEQQNMQGYAINESSEAVQGHIEVPTYSPEYWIQPELIHTTVDNLTLISFFLVLGWFFKVLTKFIQVCKEV